ncbi:MAG: hypothetical protein ABSD49_12575 [Candidatus Bathyarchaeia archaeon]|jgi:hypothetical protein
MNDLLSTLVSLVNTVIMAFGIVTTIYGWYYFKGGIVAKTLERACFVAVILFLHFLLNFLAAVDVLVVPVIGEILEFAFTVGLVYLAVAFVRDWKNLGKVSIK